MITATPRISGPPAAAGSLPSQTGNGGEILTTDGTNAAWAAGMVRLGGATGINAKTVALTNLYTVPASKLAVILASVIRVTAFTAGGKTTQAAVSFGGENPTYADWSSTADITVASNTICVATSIMSTSPQPIPIYAATTVFKLNISTGSNATTETWDVDVFGYLVDA